MSNHPVLPIPTCGSRWSSKATGFDCVVLGVTNGVVDYIWVEKMPDAATITGELPMWLFHKLFASN